MLKELYDLVFRQEMEKRSKPNAYLPALSFSSLVKRKFPPLRFCIEPFFEQGTVNMITAPPNNWKSWFLFLFSHHISAGTPFLERYNTAKAKVMIVNEEDSLRLIQDRYKLLNITDTTLDIYFRVSHGSKMTPNFVKSLIDEAKVLDVSVILFDSLRALNDANENDSQEMQKVMDMFKSIARENITVIFTHHHRKKSPFGKQDEAEASRGSTGINASVSGHLSLSEVEREGEKFIVCQHLKSKVGEKVKPFEILVIRQYEEKNGKQEVVRVDFKFAGEFKASEQKLLAAKDDILSALQPNVWQSAKDLFELKIAGMSNIRKALSVLVKEELVLSIVRKEAKNNSQGKPNEKLYSLNPDTPQEEAVENFSTEDPLDTDW